jgi:hypothetical protein
MLQTDWSVRRSVPSRPPLATGRNSGSSAMPVACSHAAPERWCGPRRREAPENQGTCQAVAPARRALRCGVSTSSRPACGFLSKPGTTRQPPSVLAWGAQPGPGWGLPLASSRGESDDRGCERIGITGSRGNTSAWPAAVGRVDEAQEDFSTNGRALAARHRRKAASAATVSADRDIGTASWRRYFGSRSSGPWSQSSNGWVRTPQAPATLELFLLARPAPAE